METTKKTTDEYFANKIARLKRNCIIAVLIICGVCVASLAFCQQRPRTVLVQAQGIVMKLNQADIDYVKSKCYCPVMFDAVKALQTMTVIKNNDAADLIIDIMKEKIKTQKKDTLNKKS